MKFNTQLVLNRQFSQKSLQLGVKACWIRFFLEILKNQFLQNLSQFLQNFSQFLQNLSQFIEKYKRNFGRQFWQNISQF